MERRVYDLIITRIITVPLSLIPMDTILRLFATKKCSENAG